MVAGGSVSGGHHRYGAARVPFRPCIYSVGKSNVKYYFEGALKRSYVTPATEIVHERIGAAGLC